MTREELKTLTNEELIDELDYCGFDSSYNEYRADIVTEIRKRMKESMRDATPEELKSVNNYIKSISKPTRVKFDFDEVQEQIDFVKPHKTVGKLISVDVLDKISKEINELRNYSYPFSDMIFDDVQRIINKYKAEV